MNERIGELLVKENLLSSEQLGKARKEAASKGVRLGAQITQLGFLEESELTDFVAKQYGVPSIDLDAFEVDPEVTQLIPEDVVLKLSMNWGVTGIHYTGDGDDGDMVRFAIERGEALGFIERGDIVVLTHGVDRESGSTSMVRVLTVTGDQGPSLSRDPTRRSRRSE